MNENEEIKFDENKFRMMAFRVMKLERDNARDQKKTTSQMVDSIVRIIEEEANAVT